MLTAHGVDADPAGALHPEAARDVDVNGDGDGAVEGVAGDAGGEARAQISVVHHLPGVQQLRGLWRLCLDWLGMLSRLMSLFSGKLIGHGSQLGLLVRLLPP